MAGVGALFFEQDLQTNQDFVSPKKLIIKWEVEKSKKGGKRDMGGFRGPGKGSGGNGGGGGGGDGGREGRSRKMRGRRKEDDGKGKKCRHGLGVKKTWP